jgi:hypothetical protein
MKRILGLVAVLAVWAAGFSARAGSRDELWRRVDEAVDKGLPKTAITNLAPIIASALKEKAYAEATKAIAKKISLEGADPAERAERLATEIGRVPTASHFFIDYLPKGVYVFEYSTRVQLRGDYQSGVAEIQCMYAPEFNSHSESVPIVVR